MVLGIEVLCEACGTELEITDVNTDHLLKVTLKARPCSKCSRPPDCQLSCEDVLKAKEDLKKVLKKEYPECFGTNKNDASCTTCSLLMRCAELEEEDDEDTEYPSCFGTSNNSPNCPNCPYLDSCSKTEENS